HCSPPRSHQKRLTLALPARGRNEPEALAETPGITAYEGLRQDLAVHLTGDQPAAGCGQGEAKMLMAVAAIDIGQARRAADGGPIVRQRRPLADPAALLGATDAGEDILQMLQQQVGALPRRWLVRCREF